MKADGIDAFWAQVQALHERRHASGEFHAKRQGQALTWMWDLIHARLHATFRDHPAVRQALAQTVQDVARAHTAPSSAARHLLDLFQSH